MKNRNLLLILRTLRESFCSLIERDNGADGAFRFTKTKAMKALLEERRKARDQNVNGGQERKVVKPVTSGGEKGLSSLVQSVKRKMDQTQHKKKRSRK